MLTGASPMDMEDTSGDALEYDPHTSLHINWPR